jgi:hypothetical protein
VRDQRAGELVDSAVGELDESRSLRAGMLELATDEYGPSRRMARKMFDETNADPDAH